MLVFCVFFSVGFNRIVIGKRFDFVVGKLVKVVEG